MGGTVHFPLKKPAGGKKPGGSRLPGATEAAPSSSPAGTLTQAIRNFAKSLEGWLISAMSEFPQPVVQSKVSQWIPHGSGRRTGSNLEGKLLVGRGQRQSPPCPCGAALSPESGQNGKSTVCWNFLFPLLRGDALSSLGLRHS